ncbi:hypothetical protein PCC9214_03330 [Planktothrix tepida]|uniref:Uncharacterized protein n=2 Tax=Planktothrix TaxID=54304 RepID=A0A1J1LQM4_9CYAN|nr:MULTISPECIES: hypothetical protein [Planktothrix]CAD5947344.1 hypothetical protein NO713_02324 [Planktothrix pseudagardhii]CAD5963299.1 hypothetical protein PCC9214_03330 [Planktothrix tepida]CUR34877.1 conserved hypothetical protein [Planktothrix tepida PCC 9214]
MDGLTKQVVALTNKVDALYEMIKQLTDQVSEHLSQEESTETTSAVPNLLEYGFSASSSNSSETRQSSSVQEHKDVLMDDDYIESNYYSREPTLTADIQIQRLTAQLTAAYNRIAALEEQLLSKRIHF